MKQPEKKLSGFQKCVSIITVLGLAVYSVVSIALVSNAYSALETNVDELGDIVNNWMMGAILDIARR
jgi:hypothetical protein